MYAKLTNGSLVAAPTKITQEGRVIYNPSGDMLAKLGYKPVIYPDDPAEVIEIDPTPKVPQYTERDGAIYVTYVDAPTPTPEDPATLREAAYRAESDQYLTAYEGYILEGKTAEAEEQKTLYLAKKAEIRERIPDNEN